MSPNAQAHRPSPLPDSPDLQTDQLLREAYRPKRPLNEVSDAAVARLY